MTLPSGVLTATVTFGPYMDDAGAPRSGTVVFRTSSKRVWTATGEVIMPRALTVTLNGSGAGSIVLPATDQPGFSDGAGNSVTDWTYTADIKLSGSNSDGRTFMLVTGGVDELTVDLDLLTPVTSTTGTTVALPSVLSVDGEVGVVDTDAATAARVGDTETLTGAAIAATVGNTKTIYVSATGSDANLGATWGGAKATISSALTAAGSAGTIILGDGTFTLTSTLNLDRLNSIIGQGPLRTNIVVDFNGIGIDWRPQVAFSGEPGGLLQGFKITPGAVVGASAVGIRVGAVTTARFSDIEARGFNGVNGIGFWFLNPTIGGTQFWTERLDVRACTFTECTVGACFDVDGGTNSFLYAAWLDFYGNVQAVPVGSPAQTGYLIRNTASLLGCQVNWMCNVAGVNGANTVAPTAVRIEGTNSNILTSLVNIRGEMTSGTAATSLSIGTGAYLQGCTGVIAFLDAAGFPAAITGGISFSGSLRGTSLGATGPGDNKLQFANIIRQSGGVNGLLFNRPVPSTSVPQFGIVSHPTSIGGRTFADTDLVVTSYDGTNNFEHARFRHDSTNGPSTEFAGTVATRPTSAAATISLTSGTAAQMPGRGDRHLVVPVTFNPTGAAAATCLVEISRDGTTYTTLGTWSKPISSPTGVVELVAVEVPSSWRIRLTVTNATLGTGVQY